MELIYYFEAPIHTSKGYIYEVKINVDPQKLKSKQFGEII